MRHSTDAERDAYDAMLTRMSTELVKATEVDQLKAENAKLRELVRIMVYCMQYERECDGCRINGADGAITDPAGCDGMFERMRELGIEVTP